MASEAVGGGASGGGLAGLFYRTVMRRNSVYIAFVLGGALVTERVIDGGLNSLWASVNRGKHYEDIPSLGTLKPEEEE